MIRVVHTADWHLHRDRVDEVSKSVETMHGVDSVLAIIAGDIWDRTINATDSSRYNESLELVQRLAERRPVALIYGTPSHEPAGSLEVFERLDTPYPIEILRPGRPYGLTSDGIICDLSAEEPGTEVTALLLGIPEPNKQWLLANESLGKHEAAEAMESALRSFLLSLAAIRKEHSELPCILVYHGRVRGSKFANGMSSEDGITVDDLRMVGADYYALGDIHEPQQIGNLPAYYPGSPAAVNWGETYKPGCNLVTLGENNAGPQSGWGGPMFAANVERIGFSHPQQKKIEQHTLDLLASADDIEGRRVWLEIHANRDEHVDTEAALQGLYDMGAADGSRVTATVRPTETVRAGQILESEGIAAKLGIWGDNSEVEITDALTEKAGEIEREVSQESGTTKAGRYRIVRLDLRGAIGTWKKQNKDEITLDLDSLDAGLVGLVGPNGHGKTTILENMHPWPHMLTRDGKLQDHFRLRDSHRILTWADQASGTWYQAKLLVDGQNKSGSVEYYLYRSDDAGATWQPYNSDINGRKDPYLAAVGELFGSLQLFLRTAFVTQRPTKNAPEINEATKGERKALLTELAGIDYLQRGSELARANAKTAEDSVTRSEGQLEAMRERQGEADELEKERADRRSEISDAQKGVAELDEQIAAKKQAVEELKIRADTEKQRQSDLEALKATIAELVAEREKLKGDRAEYDRAIEKRERAESEIAEHEELDARRQALEAERSAHIEEESKRYREHEQKRQEAQEEIRAQEKRIRELTDRQGEISREIQKGRERIDAIDDVLSREFHGACPECGAALPWADDERRHRIGLEEERGNIEARITELEPEWAKYAEEIEEAQEELNSIAVTDPYAEHSFPREKELREVRDKLSMSDINDARDTLEKAKVAGERVKAIDERRSTLAEKLSEAEGRKAKVAARPDENAWRELQEAEYELEQLREKHSRSQSDLAAAKERLSAIETRLEKLADEKRKADELAEQIESIRTDAAEWRTIERALGSDGIQALELDALSPSIAEVANRLLHAAYGSRYSIEFRTTRMGGSGKRQKQIEDFLIYVIDAEDGSEQEISTLSGGESVWFKRAIYDAFAVIRSRNTGLSFLTAFQDETDGSLDPDARVKYFRMLEAAHEESGRHQTVLVTHSSEIQAMLSQRIDVRELSAEREPVAV